MRKLWILAGALILAGVAHGAYARDTYTQGYYRQNGTYVQPHYSTAPDSNPYNNYSSQPNVNPYTGQAGTVDPYAPKPLYTAPRPYGSSYGR